MLLALHGHELAIGASFDEDDPAVRALVLRAALIASCTVACPVPSMATIASTPAAPGARRPAPARRGAAAQAPARPANLVDDQPREHHTALRVRCVVSMAVRRTDCIPGAPLAETLVQLDAAANRSTSGTFSAAARRRTA
jgi:hypothetical protein